MWTMDKDFFVQWRKDNRMTQADVAERLGVNLTSVKRWETGARKLPPFIGLLMAAVELNLTPVGEHAMYEVSDETTADPTEDQPVRRVARR